MCILKSCSNNELQREEQNADHWCIFKISNVTTKTLRYYDEIGLIKPVYVNDENGYRYYSATQLETVLLIGKLKWYGFSLDEIAEVLKNPEDNTFILSQIREKEAVLRETAQHYQMLLSLLEKDISNLERGKNIMAYLEQIEVKLVETKPMPILSIRKKNECQGFAKIYYGADENRSG